MGNSKNSEDKKVKPKTDQVEPEIVEIEEAIVVGAPENDEPENGAPESPKDEPVAPTRVSTSKKRGRFTPMLLGGVAAAAVGFGAAQYTGNGSWPFSNNTTAVSDLTATVTAQKVEITAMKATIAEMQTTLSSLPVRSDITTIEDKQATTSTAANVLSGRVDKTESRLTDIENRPIPEVGATVEAVAAYERELAAMRKMFEGELTKIESAQKQASVAGEATTARANTALENASLARIKAAVNSGVPFIDAANTLSDIGISVPESLVGVAKSGVPTLAQLQSEFPEAARAALAASGAAETDSGNVGKFGAFLRAQLGARSLEPREGDDADAVLSRAEAALRSGDIAQSITEVSALPEPALAQMAAWITQAKLRHDTVTALAALSAEMNK